MGEKKGEMSDMNGEVGGERRESLDVLYYPAVGPVVLWQQKGYGQDVVAFLADSGPAVEESAPKRQIS
jgi:hypothetical protein